MHHCKVKRGVFEVVCGIDLGTCSDENLRRCHVPGLGRDVERRRPIRRFQMDRIRFDAEDVLDNSGWRREKAMSKNLEKGGKRL
jgi:hypothetical protein